MSAVQERREGVARLRRRGLPVAAIARTLGVSARTVERDLQALGLVRTPRPWTAAEQRRAAALIEDGCSLEEVARTLGRPRTVIRRHFPGRGWTQAQISEHLAALRMTA